MANDTAILTRNYYVYDTSIIDEEVCNRQGRDELKPKGGYDEVWVHKHKHLGSCVAQADTGEKDVLGKPIYNQHCYKITTMGIEPLVAAEATA